MICSGCDCLCAIGLFIIYKLLDHLIRIPYIGRYNDRYILVTGCDTGFGHELAKRLDKLGCHVFAGCLTEKGETEVKKGCSEKLKPIPLDVSKQESVRKAFDLVKSHLPRDKGLWGVMNNAGILGKVGPSEWLTIDDYKQVMNVNFYGLVDVTMTFLPLLKKEHGRVVNTASVFGRHSLIGCVPYCASKYSVEAFTDNIRRSLIPFGCKAHLIEPGLHKTHITSKDYVNQQMQQAWNQASLEVKEEFGEEYFRKIFETSVDKNDKLSSSRISDVVDAYEHALLGYFPRARYVVGKDAKFLWLPLQWLPEWLGDFIFLHLDKDPAIPAALKKRQ